MVAAAVIIFFAFYVLLDCIAVVPRIAGSILGKNSLGYSFSNIASTIKRIFVVAYPPLLGWLSINGEDIYSVIYLSYFFSAFGIAAVYFSRKKLTIFFIDYINRYSSSGNIIKSFFGVLVDKESKVHESFSSSKGIDWHLVGIGSWVYFIYGSSLFFVNIIGHHFSNYAPIVYQTIGLINALGTIVFSFVLDPKISRVLDSKGNIVILHNSLLLSQMINVCLLGPVAILTFSFVLNIFL